jgi:PqqD family protein of HPr-rel-A system
MSVVSEERKPRGTARGKDLGDEYLVYADASDEVHVLNSTAREIYLMCDGSRTEAEIAAALAEKYDLDADRARRDTGATLARLAELGLLARD